MSKTYWKIYNTACEMLEEGIYPSPTKLNERLGHNRKHMNMLNGMETFARRNALIDKGYYKSKNGRYKK